MRKTLSAIRATVTAVKNFDWRSAMFATWVFLAICGAIALGVWFANPLRWLELVASILAVAAGWCITFKLTQAVLAWRARRGRPRRRLVERGEEAPKVPEKFRRVFLYFNPDTGEEVCKMEPVQ